ncbi:MAG: hypothetical protein ACK5Y8_17375, partial [Betaproteobacteria bacterium]
PRSRGRRQHRLWCAVIDTFSFHRRTRTEWDPMNDLLEPRVTTVEPTVTERDRARLAALLQPKTPLPAVDYAPAQPASTLADLRTQTWNPLSSRRIMAIEGLVVAAVMLYFLGGVLAVFGGL